MPPCTPTRPAPSRHPGVLSPYLLCPPPPLPDSGGAGGLRSSRLGAGPCTEAQHLVAPPPIWLTVHWVVTHLHDRLSTARDAHLQQHPSELTIDLLETTLGKIESNLLFVASATDVVAPRLFEGCAVPQLPTSTATHASAAVTVSEDTAAVSAADSRCVQLHHPPVPCGPLWCPARPPHPLVHSELGGCWIPLGQGDHHYVCGGWEDCVVSGQVAASCSCWSLAHSTILWHHRLGHLTLPSLHCMASHSLVSGLPRAFSSLPPSLAPPCTPCIVGRLRATPHSSSLRPATAPFQNLHLDVWGPAPTLGPERERYFLVVVDDYFRQPWTLPESPQQNWVDERRIGLVMDIARTHILPTSLWTGSPGVGSAFHVWGCLALVRDTSADKLSAHAIPCVFLGFPVGSPDYSFYHPPLHQFLDSRDVRFDESVSYYTWYPCRGLPVPPPPLFLASSLPPAPAPPVPPTPLVLPRQVTVDSVGVGAGGAATGFTRSGGARSRGAGVGGAGTRGSSSVGAGAGAGGAGVVVAGTEEMGAGGSPTASPTVPPHRHDTRFQALCWLEREEEERLEQERQELQQLDQQQQQQQPLQLPLLQQIFPPSQSPPLVVPHDRPSRCPPRARPSSPLADFRTVSFRSPPRRSPHVYVLPSPPESSLTVSSHPITDYYRAARPVVTRVLASLVTDPCASPSSVSALTAVVADFASTRHLDYATRVVAARTLSVGGESALGCDVLEDRQSELEFLAAATPSLCAMLLSLEGDPDALDIPTPLTYREAVSGEWASQWKAAMDSELASWRSTGTYGDAVPPPRANVVDSMWLFKVKWPPGSSPVFKARYVARGFSQREGVDFFQNFAPTPKMTTLRVLLHVAAQRDYELHSLDFSTAFLQGRLYEEIRLRRPPGFTDTFPPRTQWSLRQPVYGLCQSPREWHDTLRSTVCDLGFRPSSADPSLLVRAGSTPFFILVYVDDLVFATIERAALAEVKSELQKRHTCTDPGELQRYLGLQKYQGQSRSHHHTDSVTHGAAGPSAPFESSGPYAELMGCLMYLMTCTRPDLAFPLGVLSRFVATGRHRPVHWTAAVRVAKYLATTSGMGLVLGGTQPIVLTGHCDSSYAEDVETRRSTQGYYFILGAGAVSWRSTQSSSVALSSAEAEIYAGAMAA
ncbi:unnamed protein product [Closterium sp. NIES-54]